MGDNDIKGLIRQSPPVDVSKPYDPSTLKGKTILITGGASGLGSHMVREWASHGAHLVIGDVADAAGEELVAELRATYPDSTFAFQHCDVTDWESQVSLFETAAHVSPHGGIDVVVPNAGIILPGESMVFEAPVLVDGRIPKPNTATLEVNITGATYTTHLALYYLPRNEPASRDRCLLLIGSLASLCPFPTQCQYTMSKHAILGLFRTLRATAFRQGVRVNMITPYYTSRSNMLKPAVELMFLSGTAGGAEIEDVINAATRLVADEAIAGRALCVGPKLKSTVAPIVEEEDPLMAVQEHEGDGRGRAVWECYGEDYDNADAFVKRFVILLNAAERVKGWFGIVSDVWKLLRRK
ncbi:short-chain alcohol dehydrogenase [Fusarium albosuccineum]|uniref:Short-chain alcohol dehydrogenase n=1 Tax=Fusarium albosuccineum TaxID=1237068 RepID=A0A8H4LMZ5_9HYPO|nr:short-chain alcohol dehydrogenase [Fusarium albosuccineum]